MERLTRLEDLPVPQQPVVVYFGGECDSRTLLITYGAIIEVERVGVVYQIRGKVRPEESNTEDIATYVAAIAVLEEFIKVKWEQCFIVMKCQNKMVVEQMRGRWVIGEGSYVPFANECQGLAQTFARLKWWWVSRHEQGRVDIHQFLQGG